MCVPEEDEKLIQEALAAEEERRHEAALQEEIRNRILDEQSQQPGYRYYD